MTDRHFVVFNTVFEKQSMSLAAEELFISQPSVSRYISELEEYYQTKLFQRCKRKLIPTEKCKRLYEYSHLITSTLTQAEKLFRDNIFENKLCSIGLIPAIAETIYPSIFQTIQDSSPSIKVRTQVARSAELITSLSERTLDIVITDRPVNNPQIISSSLFTLQQSPVCAITAPYPEEMTLEELSQYPLLLKDKSSSARSTFDAAMGTFGFVPNIIAESSSNAFLLQLCADEQGITIVTKDLLKYHAFRKGLRTIRITDYNLMRSFYINYHENALYDDYYNDIINSITKTARYLVFQDN